MQQLQALPNSAFVQPEFATTAVPIAMGAGGLMALQNAGAGSNVALLTFNSAHGYTATLQASGFTLIQNVTTNHVPMQAGGVSTQTFLLFQLTGATVNTAVNGFTMAVLAIPSTTTMLVACPVTGTNPTVTAASFIPAFALQYGQFNVALGANCAVSYNPDNTGSPYINTGVNTVPAPVFRQLQAVSTTAQIESEGYAAQTIVLASGGAGTSRWSQYFR
jgi:hypothetical protein